MNVKANSLKVIYNDISQDNQQSLNPDEGSQRSLNSRFKILYSKNNSLSRTSNYSSCEKDSSTKFYAINEKYNLYKNLNNDSKIQ